jgi:pimeloyl-ACP methyl ester carboxylesterase
VDAPGAVLHYDVRGNDSSSRPVLLLVGSPMGADGFVAQAGHFTDRTVVTYDPRGAGRSKRTDGGSQTTVEEHADDLHRLIDALGAGPAEIFASSGGAVNALALVARHPEQVGILVAHEPPAAQELPDREVVLAVCEDIKETYLREGFGAATAKFIALVATKARSRLGSLTCPAPILPPSARRPLTTARASRWRVLSVVKGLTGQAGGWSSRCRMNDCGWPRNCRQLATSSSSSQRAGRIPQ